MSEEAPAKTTTTTEPRNPSELIGSLMELIKDPDGPLSGAMGDLDEFQRESKMFYDDVRGGLKALWKLTASLIEKLDETQRMVAKLESKLRDPPQKGR